MLKYTTNLITGNVVEFGFFEQQFNISKVIREKEPRVAHEIEHVPEHLAISVDKVMLLQTI